MDNQTLTDTQLRIGTWYTAHRGALRLWTIRILAGGSVGIFVFVLGSLVVDGIMGATYRARSEDMLASGRILAAPDTMSAPQGLQTQQVGSDTESVLMRIFNPNTSWVAHIRTGEGRTVTVMPGVESFGIIPAIPSEDGRDMPEVVWHRLSRAESSLVPLLPTERDFEVAESVFSVSSLPGGAFTRVSALVKNASPWNLRDAQFTVMLLRDGGMVAYSPLTIARLDAGATVPFTATWTNGIGGVNGVRLVPVFDALSPQQYGNPDPRLEEVTQYF